MEFIPQVIVTGGYMTPPEVQTGQKVGQDKLLKIYSEIREAGFAYQAFQLEGDDSGATMQGQPLGELVTVRPPLVQVQSILTEGSTIDAAGRKTQRLTEIVARVLGVAEILQLGIRIIFHAALPSNDGRDFMLGKVLSAGNQHLDELRMGAEIWGGVKYYVAHPRGTYTFNVEPAIADEMKSLYIEMDAQFPGTHSPSEVLDRVEEVSDYVKTRLGSYLDKLATV